jgi:hypothetical protein
MPQLNWEKSKLPTESFVWEVFDKHQNLIIRIQYVLRQKEWIVQILNHTEYHKGSIHQKSEIKKLAKMLFEKRLAYLSSLILVEEETLETYETDCVHESK